MLTISPRMTSRWTRLFPRLMSAAASSTLSSSFASMFAQVLLSCRLRMVCPLLCCCCDHNTEPLDFGLPDIGEGTVVTLPQVVLHPLIEPPQEHRAVICGRQYPSEIGPRRGGTARDHLADMLQVILPLTFAYRWRGITSEGCGLDGLPEGRERPASSIGVIGRDGVAQPFGRGVRPQGRHLAEHGVGFFDA